MAIAANGAFVFSLLVLLAHNSVANQQQSSTTPSTSTTSEAPQIQGSDELDILKGFASFRENLKNRTLQLLAPALKTISENKEAQEGTRIEKLRTNKGDDIVDRDMEELSRAYEQATNNTSMDNLTIEYKPDSKFPYYIISDDFAPANVTGPFDSYIEGGDKSSDDSSAPDDSNKTHGRTRAKEIISDKIEQSHESSNETYHVKYETKFSFQNVDENGLKVKYNKTEHVYYGDMDSVKPTPAEITVKMAEPAVIIPRGRCIFQVCEDNGYCEARSDCDTTYCDPDYSKPYPQCCGCEQHAQVVPLQRKQKDLVSVYDGYRAERYLPIQLYQNRPNIEEVKIMKSQIAGVSEEEESKEEEEGEMSDLERCQYMSFGETEFEKQLPGVCAMCHKGAHGDRYVAGCMYTDCDEFADRNILGDYPDCCPKCKKPVKLQNKQKHRSKSSSESQKFRGYLTLEDTEEQLEREMEEHKKMDDENSFSNIPGIFYESHYKHPSASQLDPASVESEEKLDYFG